MQQLFRQAMSSVATSVCVISTADDNGAHATTVSAFASLSMDPPMVMFALDSNSDLLKRVQATHRFGVSVLAAGQHEVALACAKKGPDKLQRVDWDLVLGVPRIAGALTFLACQDLEEFPGGDHVIVTGRVAHVDVVEGEARPCIYFRREFATVGLAS